MLLVQGDTTTAFIGAVAAFYHQIPVGHVEAGLRTRNMSSPFPEELNRQGIGLLATLHFAATQLAALNLVRESKDGKHIFVTGNTVVDALKNFQPTHKSQELSSVYNLLEHQCAPQKCRLVLLTAHRRENHGLPLQRIMQAAIELLTLHKDIMIVYPVHMNPNVRKAVEATVPADAIQYLQKGRPIQSSNTTLSRLLLTKPLNYEHLVQVMNKSVLIMTDSGGIQEEGAVLGKPILVLRENTERPEGVMAGIAKITGTDVKTIVASATELLTRQNLSVAKTAHELYGDGQAANKIAELIKWHLKHPTSPPPMPSMSMMTPVDMVIVATVWRRNTLDQYLEMLHNQTVFKRMKVDILVFQNGNHLNVSDVLQKWQPRFASIGNINLMYVHWQVPTGYFGRFAAPFMSNVHDNGYFIIFDDDLIFGGQYLENMIRVVDAGSLAVRNGRFITPSNEESPGSSDLGWADGVQVTSESDIEYDFGGQIWAGKYRWLRWVWQHPPPTLITSEDFWISAVLKRFYNITTLRPKCPSNNMQMCACSMQIAHAHQPVELGAQVGGENKRNEAMLAIINGFNYTRLHDSKRVDEKNAYTVHKPGSGPFQIQGTLFQGCLFWT
jgi:UDP-N-acetylglucosamine 2-epimerase (non-hydrolysing)